METRPGATATFDDSPTIMQEVGLDVARSLSKIEERFQNRMAVHISPARIQRVKERWEREVLASLQRQERRLQRMLPARPCPSLRVLAIGATGFHFSLCRIGEQLAGPASSSSSPASRRGSCLGPSARSFGCCVAFGRLAFDSGEEEIGVLGA